MMTKGLEKFESGNVILVAPVGKIKEYKENNKPLSRLSSNSKPLITEYIKINYARAENFRNLLKGLDTGAFGSCGASKATGSSGSSGSSGGGGLTTQGSQGGGQGQGGQSQSGQGGSGNALNDQFRILSARGSAVVDARTNTLIVRETANGWKRPRN